ncbi:MAG: asparagine synthetase B, partial [bacterium]|nr:asparagine synthetase B [bacterium]
MRRFRFLLAALIGVAFSISSVCADKLLIPMDLSQRDHLKAYGIAFWALQNGVTVEWLLNFRGGSFLMDLSDPLVLETRVRAVSFEPLSESKVAQIYALIDSENMNRVRLEQVPRIAVYTPLNKQP